jgi:hypothetical protein
MKRHSVIAAVAALLLIGMPAAFAQSPAPQPANPQVARNVPAERVPSLEQQRRERLNEEHERRLREYLAAVARMA